MAQRLRQPVSGLKADPPPYCETFARRMARREREGRPHSASTTRNYKTSSLQQCLKSQLNPNCGLLMSTPAAKPKSATISYPNSCPKDLRTTTNRMHRELVATDSALVEVTVRTHTSKKSQNTNDTKSPYNNIIQQPWSRLLKPKEEIIAEIGSSFNDFDPLRTLHFLSKELQSKLRKNGLEDPNMQKIVMDMQQALKRIPPEVTSTMGLHDSANEIKGNFTKKVSKLQHNGDIETAVSKIPKSSSPVDFDVKDLIVNGFTRVKSHLNNGLKITEKLPSSFKPPQVHRGLQTSPSIMASSEMCQNLLADSTRKLENSCKELDELCRQLRTEKEETELLLLAEKDTVKFLRKQLQDMEAGKNEEKSYKIQKLLLEKTDLANQVKKLQDKAVENHKLPAEDLKLLVQQLQIEKTNIEQENMTLRHELTLSNMEKEKYIAILNVRDRQINEIRGEMTQLQEVVNEQLFELQKGSFVSSPSSQSTYVGNFVEWQKMPSTKIDKEIGDNLSMSADGSESPLQRLLEKELQTMHLFKEVPSGDFTSLSNMKFFNSTKKKSEPDVLSGKQMKIVSVNDNAAARDVET